MLADHKLKSIIGSGDKSPNHCSSGSQSPLQNRIADLEYVVQRLQKQMAINDSRASINTPNIGYSALIIEELDWGGQDALNTCENSFFGPHLGLGRQKNLVRLGQTPDVEPPY